MPFKSIRMKSHLPFSGMVLLFLALVLQPAWPAASASLPVHAAPVDCAVVLAKLARNENWQEELVNPVLTSQAKISEQFRLYTSVHACIPASGGTELLQNIRRLTEYFMIFAGGYQTTPDGSRAYLVNLATDKDPAVQRIRQQLGIPPRRVTCMCAFFIPARACLTWSGASFKTRKCAA
jgi:hypothetical protein